MKCGLCRGDQVKIAFQVVLTDFHIVIVEKFEVVLHRTQFFEFGGVFQINLFLEYRFEDDGACAGFFDFLEVGDIVGQVAASGDQG